MLRTSKIQKSQIAKNWQQNTFKCLFKSNIFLSSRALFDNTPDPSNEFCFDLSVAWIPQKGFYEVLLEEISNKIHSRVPFFLSSGPPFDNTIDPSNEFCFDLSVAWIPHHMGLSPLPLPRENHINHAWQDLSAVAVPASSTSLQGHGWPDFKTLLINTRRAAFNYGGRNFYTSPMSTSLPIGTNV